MTSSSSAAITVWAGRIAGTAAATAVLLATSSAYLAPPALAADVAAASRADILAAWSAGATAKLSGDITLASGDNLAVTASLPQASAIDLNGHSLSIPDPGPDRPGIQVPPGTQLVIVDSVGGGALDARGGTGAAGIGGAGGVGGGQADCGALLVRGGRISAVGGIAAGSGPAARGSGAGIGGAGGFNTTNSTTRDGGNGCSVTVHRGDVEGIGGGSVGVPSGAGIGGGAGAGSVGASGYPGTVVVAGTEQATPVALGPGNDPAHGGGAAATPQGVAVTGHSWNSYGQAGSGGMLAVGQVRSAYALTFDTGGGTTIPPRTVVDGLSTGMVSDPTRPGYTFSGWHTGSVVGPDWTSFDPVYDVTTVYASWIPVPPVGNPPVGNPPVGNPPVANPPAPGNAASGVVSLSGPIGQRVAGQSVAVAASNLASGTPWTLTMFSDPVVLATGTAPADGSLNTSAPLPSSVPAGSHRLELTGAGADGRPLTATIWFRVDGSGLLTGTSTTGPVPEELAKTGVGNAVPLTVLGGLLVLAGGGALAATRRRAG